MYDRIPPLLFFHRHEGVPLRQRTFQGTVHAFVPPVLFGMAPPDTLRSDAQLYQPDGKAT
ncbi:MAG: hypothetical protein E6326_19980 [Enterobacter roggenkampii]|nr:hypothetical protein [Enterobacter roggenkampii]